MHEMYLLNVHLKTAYELVFMSNRFNSPFSSYALFENF